MAWILEFISRVKSLRDFCIFVFLYFSSQAVNAEFVFSKGINEYGKGDRSMRFRIGFKIQVGK